MNIQRTVIRRRSEIREIDETCAVILEGAVGSSEYSENKVPIDELAGKEKKTASRQKSKTRRKMKKQWFQKFRRDFWKWYAKNEKLLVFILVCSVLYLHQDMKEFLLDEKLILFLHLVLSLK